MTEILRETKYYKSKGEPQVTHKFDKKEVQQSPSFSSQTNTHTVLTVTDGTLSTERLGLLEKSPQHADTPVARPNDGRGVPVGQTNAVQEK